MGPSGPAGPSGPVSPVGPFRLRAQESLAALPGLRVPVSHPLRVCRLGPGGPITPSGPCGPTSPPAPAARSVLLGQTRSDRAFETDRADGTFGPSGPIGPAGPSGPSKPIGPKGPGGPSGPAGPIGPAGPSGPIGPCSPSTPLVPWAPACPAAPDAPSLPAAPGSPSLPTVPGAAGSATGSLGLSASAATAVEPSVRRNPPPSSGDARPAGSAPTYGPAAARFGAVVGAAVLLGAGVDRLRVGGCWPRGQADGQSRQHRQTDEDPHLKCFSETSTVHVSTATASALSGGADLSLRACARSAGARARRPAASCAGPRSGP